MRRQDIDRRKITFILKLQARRTSVTSSLVLVPQTFSSLFVVLASVLPRRHAALRRKILKMKVVQKKTKLCIRKSSRRATRSMLRNILYQISALMHEI